MSYTYVELTERLVRQLDVYELIELMGLSIEDILDRFEDKVMKDYEMLEEYISE